MDEKHGEDFDSYISVRARLRLIFDCEALRLPVFGSVEGTSMQCWGTPGTPEELRGGDGEAWKGLVTTVSSYSELDPRTDSKNPAGS